LLKKGTHPEQEIDKVTTPKGCTIARRWLHEREHQGFSFFADQGAGGQLGADCEGYLSAAKVYDCGGPVRIKGDKARVRAERYLKPFLC